MVFHWNLRDSKGPKVSRYYDNFTFCDLFTSVLANGFSLKSKWQHVSSRLAILTEPQNAGIWIVSIHPPLSNYDSAPYQAFRDSCKLTNYNCYHQLFTNYNCYHQLFTNYNCYHQLFTNYNCYHQLFTNYNCYHQLFTNYNCYHCQLNTPQLSYFSGNVLILVSLSANFDWFGLVSLFNGISTFVGYLMPKPFPKKNSSGTI